MVTFENGRLTIVIPTARPAEDWKNTADNLIDLLQSENPELHTSRYDVLQLLRHMLPDSGQIDTKVNSDNK